MKRYELCLFFRNGETNTPTISNRVDKRSRSAETKNCQRVHFVRIFVLPGFFTLGLYVCKWWRYFPIRARFLESLFSFLEVLFGTSFRLKIGCYCVFVCVHVFGMYLERTFILSNNSNV